MIRRLAACALAALAAGALAACGEDAPAGPGERTAQRSERPPELVLIIRRARCHDWRDAPVAHRRAAVERLHDVVRGPNGIGSTLGDEQAYEIIDSRCRQHFARGFLIYEMYTRAAAFDGYARRAREGG